MKLVIAEKPSQARDIKKVVGDEYVVTSAYGHLYELAEPDEYLSPEVPTGKNGKKVWRAADLPIIPKTWKLKAKDSCKDQISKIKELLKKADLVVNAGDPDREGQLLIDEILAELKYTGPVMRVWLKSLTDEGIKAAFSNLHPNSEFKSLCDTAIARSHADWLVGMNLTRAWTLKSGELLSVGRVQSPTLALIVARDEAIESFHSRGYFEIHARVKHQNGNFIARWKPVNTEGRGFDEEGRLVNLDIANSILAKAGKGAVKDFKSQAKTRSAPLPFSLSALQKQADIKHGIGAQETLDLVQYLYENKYTSYPRTDCQYLGSDQQEELRKIAENLAQSFGVTCNGNHKHAAFNDKKVGAHTALVPTGKDASDLTGNHAIIFDMIVRSVVGLFMGDEEYQSLSVSLDFGGEEFTATGKHVTKNGWTDLYCAALDEDEGHEPTLPTMEIMDIVEGEMDLKSLKTNPPKRFIEGTLIDAMSSIHRYVEDPIARAKLKETSGIGTEATRGNIIETLYKRGWIEKQKGGKSIRSTVLGREVVKMLPAQLTDPVTTATWEDRLSLIEEDKLNRIQFEEDIVRFVKEQLKLVESAQVVKKIPIKKPGANEAQCPLCSGTARRLESSKKKGLFFWACSNKEHGLMSDDKGRPGKEFEKKVAA